ncbi:MAG: hypothetical protein CAPSK01_000515 [Candidatus Accumulibacter vicinus]|uniref:Uncharacterized protein n=1 Tax=Candidatus Accumulibacter vicinus TaxID=2954382 RepID=A0A084Y508_9PROT|nr:MAG: hypothetical protein CAPSK01_000515 [Candidatus Accumulibacter vicinus]
MPRHHGEQFRIAEGLAQKVVATGIQNLLALLLETAGRESNDFGLVSRCGGLDPPRRFAPVHAGHAHVHQDQLRLPAMPLVDGLLTVAGLGQLETQWFQQAQQQAAVIDVVIHHQNATGGLTGFQTEYRQVLGRGLRGRLCRVLNRNLETERATHAQCTFGMDRAAQELDELAADGQAQAGALGCPLSGRRLHERNEDPLELVGGDARAGIAYREAQSHGDGRLARHDGDRQADATLLGELEGVAEQVDQHLPQLDLIATHIARGFGGELDIESQALFLGLERKHSPQPGEQFVEVELDGVHHAAPGFDARQLQHVVDEGEQMLATAMHSGQVLPLSWRELFATDPGVAQQHVGEAQHGVQRRAQFVAHVGQEGALGLVRRLGRILGLGQRFRLLGQCARAFGNLELQLAVAPLDDADAVTVGDGQQRNAENDRQNPEPGGLPPGRQDHDTYRLFLFAPEAVVVRRPDPEDIGARIEVGVGGEAAPAVHLVPVPFEAVQPVGVAVLVGKAVVQSGKLEGKHRLVVAKGHCFGFVDRLLQWRIRGADDDRLVEDLEPGNHDGRKESRILDLLGIEGVDAVDPSEIEFAVIGPASGFVEIIALQSVAFVVIAKRTRARIESRQPAAPGADP